MRNIMQPQFDAHPIEQPNNVPTGRSITAHANTCQTVPPPTGHSQGNPAIPCRRLADFVLLLALAVLPLTTRAVGEAPAAGGKTTKAVSATRLMILGTAAGCASWRGSDNGGFSAAVQVGEAVYVVDLGRDWSDHYLQSDLAPPGTVNRGGGLERLKAVFIALPLAIPRDSP